MKRGTEDLNLKENKRERKRQRLELIQKLTEKKEADDARCLAIGKKAHDYLLFQEYIYYTPRTMLKTFQSHPNLIGVSLNKQQDKLRDKINWGVIFALYQWGKSLGILHVSQQIIKELYWLRLNSEGKMVDFLYHMTEVKGADMLSACDAKDERDVKELVEWKKPMPIDVIIQTNLSEAQLKRCVSVKYFPYGILCMFNMDDELIVAFICINKKKGV